MKQKLLTLMTLLVLCVTGAWGQTENVGDYSTQVISADGRTSTWTFILPSSQVNAVDGKIDNDILYKPSASGKMKFTSSNQFSWQGESSGYIYVPAGASGTITMTVKGSSDTRYLQLYVDGKAASENYRLYSKLNAGGITADGKKGPQSFAFTASQLTTVGGKTYLHFKDNNTEMKIATFTVTLTSGSYSAPSSNTVTYNANGGTGSMDNSTGASITLSSNSFTAPTGYSFAGWNTANDGSGTSYTAGQEGITESLNLYATWTQNGTIDANTGSANTTYTATLNATSIAIDAAPTKAGNVLKGYYTAATGGTKVANADGTLVASTGYTDENGKWTNSGAAPTLYAQWEEADYVFTPTGTISDTSLSKGDEVKSSTGGKMEFTGTEGTLKYTNAGLEFGSTSACQVTVTLDRLMQVGTKISITLYNTNDDKERGLKLNDISGTTKATMTETNKGIEFTKTYTVVAGDGLAGSNQFVLQRSNNTYLKKVVVNNCVQPKEITITDLSKIDGSKYTGKNYATLYYSDVALAVPSGVKAYTYKMDGEALVVSRTYENGGTYRVIPAGEAVVVESDAGASYNFNVSTTDTPVDEYSLLKGTDASTTIEESGYKYYKLAMNDALTSVGFYFAEDGGTSITNGAHKAYLRVSTTASKEYFVLGGEGVEEPQNETDGINAVSATVGNGVRYNLAGQRVSNDYKGIVIVNGKKMLNK